MNNYFISKDNKSGEIVYLEYDKEGYKVTPKRKKKDAIEVNKIVFVSPSNSMPSITKIGYKLTLGKKDPKIVESDKINNWKKFIESGKDVTYVEQNTYSKNKLAVLLHTGGTTGKSKEKKIDHKLDKLLYELNLINIDDEDNDSGNSEKIRDMLKEAEKFRLSIINNYKKYLGNSYITLTLKKMQIIIDGYKAKLYAIKERENEKILISMFNQMKMEEPEKKGKGR